MSKIYRWALSAILGLFAIWCLFSFRHDLSHLPFTVAWHSWKVLLLAASFSILNYVLRILRWRWYLSRLGYTFSIGFIVPTYVAGFAFTLSPGKLGEFYRAKYYAEAGVPLQTAAAASVVERLMDLVSVLMLSVLMLTPLPGLGHIVFLGTLAFLAGLVLLMAAPWETLARKSGRPAIAGMIEAAAVLLRPVPVLWGFTSAIVAWGLEGLGLGVLTLMFQLHQVNFFAAAGIYAVSVLAGVISFLPGGLGSTEALMTSLLSEHGYPLASALIMTFFCRLMTLWLAVFLGWCAVLYLGIRKTRSYGDIPLKAPIDTATHALSKSH